MRHSLSPVLIVCLFSFPLLVHAESDGGSSTGEAKPQIAFHLFSTWADNYMVQAKRDRVIGSSILYGAGSLLAAGSVVTWLKGDDMAESATGAPMDPTLKQNLTMGLGIGAGVLYLTGIVISVAPIKDYRSIYADVFKEKDPEVQEAMAVSVLRYQADQGKERRITSFISGLVVPILAGGIVVGANLAQREPWSTNVLNTLSSASWSMSVSILQLFEKTPEERLYERYLNTRDALYSQAAK